MRDAFEFSYSSPQEEIISCYHRCKNKNNCSHKCCKGIKVTSAKLSIVNRDGSIITRYLRSSSDVIESSLPGEDNDSFWGEFNNNRRVNTKDVVRVVTNARDEDFEYGNISFDDIETDDDYQENL